MAAFQRYSFWRDQLGYNRDPWDWKRPTLTHRYHPYGWPIVSQLSLLPFASTAFLYANRSIVHYLQPRSSHVKVLLHMDYMESHHLNSLRIFARTQAHDVKHVLVVTDAPFPSTRAVPIWRQFPRNVTWWCTNPALPGMNLFTRGIANAFDWAHMLRRSPLTPLKTNLLHCGYMNVRTHPMRRAKLRVLQDNGFTCFEDSADFAISAESLRSSHFVASPRGNGPQNHREWEALMVGSIPIVDYDPITAPLWKNLPVVQVTNWSVVTPQFLWSTLAKMREREYRYEELDVRHYLKRMGL